MPFRSKETLEAWLDEFRSGRDDGNLIEVIVQDGRGGADTGLVVVPLSHASTQIVMEPTGIGEARWVVRFAAREDDFTLTAADLLELSVELEFAGSLCDFLERKSAGHTEL